MRPQMSSSQYGGVSSSHVGIWGNRSSLGGGTTVASLGSGSRVGGYHLPSEANHQSSSRGRSAILLLPSGIPTVHQVEKANHPGFASTKAACAAHMCRCMETVGPEAVQNGC